MIAVFNFTARNKYIATVGSFFLLNSLAIGQDLNPHRIVNGCVIQNGTNCPRVNWEGQNLNSSKLHGAILSGANLKGASFYKTGLSRSDLRNADLRGANLNRANLVGADLRGANIEGASMKSTILNGAIWIDGRRCAGDPNATEGGALASASIFGGSSGTCR